MLTEERLRAYLGIGSGDPWPAYVWPGGYSIIYVADDGESICSGCMNTQAEIHFGGDRDGWRIDGTSVPGVNCDWPDPEYDDEICANCNKVWLR